MTIEEATRRQSQYEELAFLLALDRFRQMVLSGAYHSAKFEWQEGSYEAHVTLAPKAPLEFIMGTYKV